MTEPANHQMPEPDSDDQSIANSGAKKVVVAFVVCAFVLFAAFVWFVAPATNGGTARRRSPCMNNLKQLGLALHNYHDTYGSFPPAYVADAQGNPMHSWRVLLLPKLGEKVLYKQYRFDEPWNGPNNSKLADQMPGIFNCPSNSGKRAFTTNYVAVVGPKTAWPGTKSVRFRDIKDGSSNTILLVEVANSGINWMEPRDLSADRMPMVLNSPKTFGISSNHDAGAQAVFGDGRVKFLSNDLPPETLRRLLEINDGEKIGEY